MFYPHADDENVAMGYANHNHKEENTMVTIGEKAFRAYIFANYFQKLDKGTLIEILDEQIDTEILIDMAQKVWELPFELSDGKIELVDPEALLLKHSEPEECFDCPDLVTTGVDWEADEDYDLISYDEDEEFAPYDDLDDDLDEDLEEIENEET